MYTIVQPFQSTSRGVQYCVLAVAKVVPRVRNNQKGNLLAGGPSRGSHESNSRNNLGLSVEKNLASHCQENQACSGSVSTLQPVTQTHHRHTIVFAITGSCYPLMTQISANTESALPVQWKLQLTPPPIPQSTPAWWSALLLQENLPNNSGIFVEMGHIGPCPPHLIFLFYSIHMQPVAPLHGSRVN